MTHRQYNLLDDKNPVVQFYYRNHTQQTYSIASEKRRLYDRLTGPILNIWDTMSLLESILDESDPDAGMLITQSQHAFQTAEAIRVTYPDDECLQLVGLIHDLGKILMAFYHEPDHYVVGDTFPLGCAFETTNVYHEFFKDNPDSAIAEYSTPTGIYEPHIGFDNVVLSYGHDEYLYHVLKTNGCTLPDEYLYIIRYHSFYPFHAKGGYRHLASDRDLRLLPLLQKFQSFDLYSKTNKIVEIDSSLKSYYHDLIDKYFPKVLQW